MKKFALIGPVVVILTWLMVSLFKLVDPFFLPSPFDVFIELFTIFKTGNIIPDILATTLRIFKSFFIALLIGIPIGLFLGEEKKIYKNLEFIIDFFRSFPPMAIFPLFLLFFGISDNSKIAVAVFGSSLIIVFNTAYGVFNSKKSRILAAKIMGASKWKIFKWIIFWESLPQTFIGLRSGISMSLMIIIVTEMFVGSNIGLGRRLMDSQLVYNVREMYAILMIVGIIGYTLNYVLLYLERKFVHWIGK